jgi:hypothetical protein
MHDTLSMTSDPAVRSSGLLDRRVSAEQVLAWRKRQWQSNVARLKRAMRNVLTLGLGERLWYGDVLYQDLNPSLLVRIARLLRIYPNNLKMADAMTRGGGDQIPAAGNECERRWYRRIRLTNRYEVQVVFVHKTSSRPNAKTQRRRATEQQMQTGRAIRRPLK